VQIPHYLQINKPKPRICVLQPRPQHNCTAVKCVYHSRLIYPSVTCTPSAQSTAVCRNSTVSQQLVKPALLVHNKKIFYEQSQVTIMLALLDYETSNISLTNRCFLQSICCKAAWAFKF